MATSSPTSACIILALLWVLEIAVLYVQGRGFFIFGDSIFDNGNNNYLDVPAQANQIPYGIDYPTHIATGRFSNGLHIPDFISQKIGLPEAPLPYLSPELKELRLLFGANFASAGAGLLNDTFADLNIIRMDEQVDLFAEYKQRISKLVGDVNSAQFVNDALFLISTGANDITRNYFGQNSTYSNLTLQEFISLILTKYQKLLLKLHDLGAQKVLVMGTGQLGCSPSALAIQNNGQCLDQFNQAAALYNPQLGNMLDGLNKQIGKAVFIGINTHKMYMDFMSRTQDYGFVSMNTACCGNGLFNGIPPCSPFSNLCPDRDQYAFWDPNHPTEKMCRLIVDAIFSGPLKYVNPMNLSTLLALDASSTSPHSLRE